MVANLGLKSSAYHANNQPICKGRPELLDQIKYEASLIAFRSMNQSKVGIETGFYNSPPDFSV